MNISSYNQHEKSIEQRLAEKERGYLTPQTLASLLRDLAKPSLDPSQRVSCGNLGLRMERMGTGPTKQGSVPILRNEEGLQFTRLRMGATESHGAAKSFLVFIERLRK